MPLNANMEFDKFNLWLRRRGLEPHPREKDLGSSPYWFEFCAEGGTEPKAEALMQGIGLSCAPMLSDMEELALLARWDFLPAHYGVDPEEGRIGSAVYIRTYEGSQLLVVNHSEGCRELRDGKPYFDVAFATWHAWYDYGAREAWSRVPADFPSVEMALVSAIAHALARPAASGEPVRTEADETFIRSTMGETRAALLVKEDGK